MTDEMGCTRHMVHGESDPEPGGRGRGGGRLPFELHHVRREWKRPTDEEDKPVATEGEEISDGETVKSGEYFCFCSQLQTNRKTVLCSQ